MLPNSVQLLIDRLDMGGEMKLKRNLQSTLIVCGDAIYRNFHHQAQVQQVPFRDVKQLSMPREYCDKEDQKLKVVINYIVSAALGIL